MNQIEKDDSIRLCGTTLSRMPEEFESRNGTDKSTGTLRQPQYPKDISRYHESFFFRYSNELDEKTSKTMGNGWIEQLQEVIELNVVTILDGKGSGYAGTKEKHIGLFIIFELFQYGKKKAALQLVDNLPTDGLSPDDMKFLGLLLIRQQEYDRALPFLTYAVINNPTKEIEILEGFLSYFKHQSISLENGTGTGDSQSPETSVEFFMDPNPIDELYHPPIRCDFLDILRSYQTDFENGTIQETQSYRIYRLIAEYHIWETGDFRSATDYCKKGLKCDDFDNYRLLGDIALIIRDPLYAIAAYEKGMKSGDHSCLLGIADGMEQLGEVAKQENYIHKAVEFSVPGARKKLFDFYMTQGNHEQSAWEQFQYLIEKEIYIPTQEELNSMQEYNERFLGEAVFQKDIEGILSAYYSLGMYCSHPGYQVAYWQQIYTIIYSDHHHLDTLTQYIEKNWEDQMPSDGGDEKAVFYNMLLAEMDTFRNFCGDRGEFEYINYQTFGEICEYFNDREGAAEYYSLYLLNNPAIPRAESLYYEKFIENRDNRAYIQGMRYKN